MTSGMPELGSKISLISKADIRYEGRLFTVDPQECTIALASVRSFGTEDRETQYPVSPQNQIYDYILFRGSDIKDIRVVNNVQSMPNDPAIMKLSGPPQQGLVYPSQPPPQAAPGFGHPLGGYAAYHPMAAPRPPMQASELSEPGLLQHGAAPGPHHFGPAPPPQQQQIPTQQQPPQLPPVQTQAQDQGSMLDLIGGNSQMNNVSRPTTPTFSAQRKSPTADQGTQVGSSNQNRDNRRSQPQNQRYSNSKNRNQQSGSNQQQPQQNQQPQTSRQNNTQQQNHHQQNHQQNYGYQGNNQYQRGGWRGRGNRARGGPAGRWNSRSKTTLKFDSEYDFEQANTQFEELRSQLAKVKIGEGDGAKPEAPEGEKKEDSGNETGGADHEPEEDDASKAYDKNKSFFDNISCEAVERSKGRSQRTDWRTERKLNTETFGVGAARRGLWRPRSSWRSHYQGWRGGRGGNQQQRGNPRPRETAEAK